MEEPNGLISRPSMTPPAPYGRNSSPSPPAASTTERVRVSSSATTSSSAAPNCTLWLHVCPPSRCPWRTTSRASSVPSGVASLVPIAKNVACTWCAARTSSTASVTPGVGPLSNVRATRGAVIPGARPGRRGDGRIGLARRAPARRHPTASRRSRCVGSRRMLARSRRAYWATGSPIGRPCSTRHSMAVSPARTSTSLSLLTTAPVDAPSR